MRERVNYTKRDYTLISLKKDRSSLIKISYSITRMKSKVILPSLISI